MVITGLTEAAFPALIQPLLDRGFSGTAKFEVWWVPVAILGIFILRGIGTLVSAYAMAWVANNVLRDIRRQMFETLLSLPTAYYDKTPAGQLISRIVTEVNGVLAGITSVLITLVRDTVVLAGLVGWLFWINWKLTLVVLLIVPPIVILLRKIGRRMANVSSGQISANSDLTSVVEEAIWGNRVIKVFGGQNYQKNKFSIVNEKFRRFSMKVAMAHAMQAPTVQFFVAIAIAIIVSLAVVQARAGDTSIGAFISFITAMLMTLSPVKHLSEVNAQIQRSMASAKVVFQLLDQPSEPTPGTHELKRCDGLIEFKNVFLTYHGRDFHALHDVSLTIQPGQTVAFVGPSGGGKSSIVNLVPRIYDPVSGDVYLDGKPLRHYTLTSLRAQVSVVSQDVVLFNDTIRNNIGYGRTDISDHLVWSVLTDVGLTAFVKTLPLGLDTVIGDRGAMLSGGQKQRLSIARALLKDAPILILDEPTAALDLQSEQELGVVLAALKQGKTTLVIAHRLSTIQGADVIHLVMNGRIVESGTHSSLLLKSKVYAELNRLNAIIE